MKRLILVAIVVTAFATPLLASNSAWVFAHAPSSPAYTPNPAFAYNPAGGPISITRPSVGNYTVRFTNLATIADVRGNVQVTDFGVATSRCRVLSFAPSGNDILINVRCQNPAGAIVDGQFTLLFTSN